MKKITLLLIALTFTCISMAQDSIEFTNAQNGSIRSAQQAPCTTEFITPSAQSANGPANTAEFGENFIVPANTFFSVENGVISIIATLGQDVTTVFPDITFRIYGENETDSSIPGELVGEEVVTDVTVVNTGNLNANLDGYEVSFNLATPILLEASIDNDTAFWFSIFIPNSLAAQTFVETGTQNTDDSLAVVFRGGTDSTGTWSPIGNGNTNLSYSLNGDCDELLSVSDNNLLSDSISLFPNPTNGDMTLSFARSFGEADIKIANITGQVVMDTTADTIGSTQIETSALATGVYFAQISTESASTVIKFVKN